MKSATKAKTITFGFGEDSDVRIVEYKIFEEGINFKLFSNGSFVPVILNNCFGKPYAYAAAAAACVGISLGLNLVEISEALLSYQGSPGRMRLLSGIKNTRILDDTYNASPISMHAALETLESIPAKRKIAILGDMREIGKYNYETHEAIGYLAASVSDIIVAVGDSAKIILEGAKNKGFPSEKLFHFYSSEEAGPKVQEIIKEGDLILVKGARAMRMEKIVEEIMAEPQRAKELLVH
jgi:UDP-N-acetylmuramyl pentapeptide synthase